MYSDVNHKIRMTTTMVNHAKNHGKKRPNKPFKEDSSIARSDEGFRR